VVILSGGHVVAAGRPEELTRTGGVEIQTGGGVRRYAHASRDDIPRLVSELVSEGVAIYEVSVIRATLEEVYLQALGRE
jgi:ABC-type multidrug transport system ATPase subunit